MSTPSKPLDLDLLQEGQITFEVERPCLYSVGVPIGNVLDLSFRAYLVLSQVDVIFAEDTRKAGILLSKMGVSGKKLVALHDHNENALSKSWPAQLLKDSMAAALITDAGTPCISDPGFRLFRSAHEVGLLCRPVPGPAASVTLLSAAGIATDRFCFVGFVPNKEGKRRKEISEWLNLEGYTIVFFESASRVLKTLSVLSELAPNARLAFGRELTKTYEEIKSFGTATECKQYFEGTEATLKGEFVWALEVPKKNLTMDTVSNIDEQIQNDLEMGLSSKEILAKWIKQGLKKNEVYPKILQIKNARNYK